MAKVSVRDMVRRYEDLIAAESRKAWVTKRMMARNLVESAPGEPHCGFLKVITAVEIPKDVPYDAVGIVGESVKTFKLKYIPESQSKEKLQWIHQADSGCFKLAIRRLTHLARLHRSSELCTVM